MRVDSLKMSYVVSWVISMLLILSKESVAQNNDTDNESTYCFDNVKVTAAIVETHFKCQGHGKKSFETQI